MQQERETAELCRNDCGFFGAPGSGGMCSVCWKKTMSDRQAAATTTSSTTVTSLCLDETKATDDVTSFESMTSSMETTENTITSLEKTTEKRAEKLSQTNKKRCWECKKKVGLTAIECRCGYVFCGSHRFEDQHNCSFDFKMADRAELARRNPGGGAFSKLEKL